jgi:hypothetical protein
VTSDEWTEATVHADQLSPGEWESWVSWHDGTSDRRVLYRPRRDDETRCDLSRSDGAVCCLSCEHVGPHIPIGAGQAAMPFIVAP